MDYSKIVKPLRGKILLSQQEMAKELGVSFAIVNRWENGLFEPTMKVKRKLRELFKEAGISEE